MNWPLVVELSHVHFPAPTEVVVIARLDQACIYTIGNLRAASHWGPSPNSYALEDKPASFCCLGSLTFPGDDCGGMRGIVQSRRMPKQEV